MELIILETECPPIFRVTAPNKMNNFQVKEEGHNGVDDEEDNEDIVHPGGHRLNKKYICIRYPGNVINVDKAVETLGGISQISTVSFLEK